MTRAWDRFVDEFLRRPDPDGPDLGTLDALPPAERDAAVDVLLGAAAQGSVPAIQGLAHLRADRAAEPLRAVMRRYSGVVRVYAAAALWWLRRDGEALATLCNAVVHPASRRSGQAKPATPWALPLRSAPDRVHAAAVLSQIDHPEALRALAQVIHDPDYDLRYHAYEGLAEVLGRSREIWNYVCKPDIHHHVRSRVDAVLRRAGLLE